MSIPTAPLRALFASALRASLATPLENRGAAATLATLLAGCGVGPLAGFDLPACVGGELALSGLRPQSAVDYTELRRVSSFGGPDTQSSLLTSSGQPCSGAQSPPTCQQALSTVKTGEGFGKVCVDLCSGYAIVTTKGDAVTVVDTSAALLGFLGAIDSSVEAVLLAKAAGYSVSCSDPVRGGVRSTATGYEVVGTQGFACGEGTSVRRYVVAVNRAGAVTQLSEEVIEVGNPGCAIGRRPAGLRRPRRAPQGSRLGRYLAQAAALEAASVDAFQILGDELARLGAPAELLAEARRAAADEVRHARLMTALARRAGVEPQRPVVERRAPRPLLAVALENAVEGCVREAASALLACRQALALSRRPADAGDELLPLVLAGIAEDETRHGALSLAVARWATPRLTRGERAQVRDAQQQAMVELYQEWAQEPAPALRAQVGLPGAEEALVLLQAFTRELPHLLG